MTKTQREEWDSLVTDAHNVINAKTNTLKAGIITAADVYIRKLERELQALKNKKTMAALLMKKA